jgi:hypothetical protein
MTVGDALQDVICALAEEGGNSNPVLVKACKVLATIRRTQPHVLDIWLVGTFRFVSLHVEPEKPIQPETPGKAKP